MTRCRVKLVVGKSYAPVELHGARVATEDFQRQFAGAPFARDGVNQRQHLLCNMLPSIGRQDHHIVNIDQCLAGEGGETFDAVDQPHRCFILCTHEGQHTEGLWPLSQGAHQMGPGKVAQAVTSTHGIPGISVQQRHQGQSMTFSAIVGTTDAHAVGLIVHFKVSAIRWAQLCAWLASRASTITRTSGSVPLARINTRPWLPSSCSTDFVAAASWELVCHC